MRKVTITHARAQLRALWDEIERTGTPIIVQRRGHADIALLLAADLRRIQVVALTPLLELLAKDIDEHPERVCGFPAELLSRMKQLSAAVPIDHEATVTEPECPTAEQLLAHAAAAIGDAAHAALWLDTPLPILHGRTPRDTAQTAAGWRLVQTVLAWIEYGV